MRHFKMSGTRKKAFSASLAQHWPVSAGTHERRRWKILILPRLQLKYALMIFIGFLISAIVTGGFLYVTSERLLSTEIKNPIIVDLTHRMTLLMMAELYIYAFGIAAFGLVLSHRIAGPLYHFKKSMDTVATGDLTHRIQLRSSDELKDIAASFNGMIESLQKLAKDDQEICRALSKELKEIAQENGIKPTKVADRLQSLSEKLARCTSKFSL